MTRASLLVSVSILQITEISTDRRLHSRLVVRPRASHHATIMFRPFVSSGSFAAL
jgi:hypothetical protein